jgi:hypothetical protein
MDDRVILPLGRRFCPHCLTLASDALGGIVRKQCDCQWTSPEGITFFDIINNPALRCLFYEKHHGLPDCNA